MSYRPQTKDFSTKAIHVGQDPEQWMHRSIIPPIITSTVYELPPLGETTKYTYTRFANPTRDALAQCLASLDNAKHCILYSSATSATTSITQLLNTGDHIIVCSEIYSGIKKTFNGALARNGIEVEWIDAMNLDNVKNAIRNSTRLVWLESPTNPCLKLYDIDAISKLVHSYGNIIVAVDNSMMTPYFQRPLELGADMVVYSVGKYISGHSDVVMGSVVLNDDKLFARLSNLEQYFGAPAAPFDCYLVNRSLKTLSIRMEKHFKSALTVAKFLESHARVKCVLYPGLPSHPQFELTLKQTHGSSGLLSFHIDGGYNEVKKFLQSLKVFRCARSFGGFDRFRIPTCCGDELTQEERLALGLAQSLIRIAVGLEDVEHLVDDLKQALEAAFQSSPIITYKSNQ